MTDGNGHFRIEGFPLPERLQLFASATRAGFAKARSPLLDLSIERPNAVTEIVLTPGGTIRGTVTDTAGRPLINTKVTFTSREFPNDPTDDPFTAETNADGQYFIEHCTPGLARVAAVRPGFVSQVKLVTVKEAQVLDRINFKLVQGGAITGVLADYSGNPVAGARVYAIPLEKATGFGNDLTDKKGEFTIGGLSTGSFRLEASFPLTTAHGEQSYTFILPRVTSGSTGVPFDCDLEAGASGKVVDEEGRGVNNFRMVLRSRTDTQPSQDFRFSIDRVYKLQGLFQLDKVPRGLYTMEIHAEGYETYRNSDVVIGPHKMTNLPRIRLNSAAAIHGRVISTTDQQPISNAAIRVLDTSLPESVTVTRTELAAYSRLDIIEYLEIAYDNNADLDPQRLLRPFARVRGNVRTRAKSDSSGLFKVGDLGSGRYIVEVEHPRYESVRLENVVVSRDNTADLGDVHMQPGGTVQGRVVDGEGIPLPNASIKIPGERVGRNTARTDAGGNYLIRGVRAGRWPVTVRTTVRNRVVYAFSFAEVRQDQTTQVDFVLALSASVRGVPATSDNSVRNGGTARLYVTDENGTVLGDIQYSATIRSGEFVINGIPPGKYLAVVTGSASGGAFSFVQVVEVPRGTTDMYVPLGTAQVAGTAVGQGDVPVAGARLQLRPVFASLPLPKAVYSLLVRNATTPANGRFSFRYLQAGLWHLHSGDEPGAAPAGEFYLLEGQRLSGLLIPAGAP